MRVLNPLNGFVRLEAGEHVLLCDAWLTEGIFDGAWVPYPPIHDPAALLTGATHCFISHIHEDHYDLKTLERLDRTVTMLVPDVYPNHLIDAKLRELGFAEVRMLRPEAPAEISRDLTIEVIPRMNAFGQELEHYEAHDLESLVIDTGVIVSSTGLKVVLLADNVPYCPEDAGSSLERMAGCDLLGFSYNGAASDYPLCYENLDNQAKRAISDEREAKREECNRALIDLVRPKALMPYSSEFALVGPMAKKFAAWCGEAWWAHKSKVVERYTASTGLPTFGLYEGDELIITRESGYEFVKQSVEPPPLAELANSLYSRVPNTRNRYPQVRDLEEVAHLVEKAASYMFQKIEQYGLATDWTLCLALEDSGWKPLYLDFRERRVSERQPEKRSTLTCFLEANYLAGLLRGECHWNNAMISYNLRWKREPNLFERSLFDALNYFHVPRTVAPAAPPAETV